MTRLSAASLARRPAVVQVPRYDRDAVRPGIVHVGAGGFHRAHMEAYLDDLFHLPGHEAWGLCGVGLLPADAAMRDALAVQDHYYTLVTRGSGPDRARVIGSIVRYLYAPDDPGAVAEAMAAPETRIVSLTITDRGYYPKHGTGGFDDQHPEIVHDLARPDQPIGTFGYLAEALDRRRARGLGPFTVVSCDNLQNNGDLARRMLLAFLAARDPALRDWVADRGAFPNSMVDRITPVTTEEHRALVRERFDIDDAWPVTTEPFTQWVLEEQFADGRPPWELVGVQVTSEVGPYETMKIRLLNGGHQVLCYPGLLLGYRQAPEAMADPQIRALLRRFMDDEVTPLLPSVPGVDLEVYKPTLLERFAKPAINDQFARLGSDVSSRIPEFVVPTVRGQAAVGGPVEIGAFAVACWLHALRGVDDLGRPLPVNDPMADALQAAALRAGSDPREILSIPELFGPDLVHYAPFTDAVGRALRCFDAAGVRATLAGLLAG